MIPFIPKNESKTVKTCKDVTESVSTHFYPYKNPRKAYEKLYPKVNERQENKVIDLIRRIKVFTDYFSSPLLKKLYTTYYKGAKIYLTTIEPRFDIKV